MAHLARSSCNITMFLTNTVGDYRTTVNVPTLDNAIDNVGIDFY